MTFRKFNAMSATELAKELANIHHFHLDHYAPSLPPKFCIISFLRGITVVPRQKEDTGYTKFWGVNMVHYGLCENGELLVLPGDICLISSPYLYWRAVASGGGGHWGPRPPPPDLLRQTH